MSEFTKFCYDYIPNINDVKKLPIIVLNSIKSDPKSWIFSVTIGALTYYCAKFYYKVFQYPKGPFPLPFIGNLWIFANKGKSSLEIMADNGPVYTLWIGSLPTVVINDLDILKEAFHKMRNEIAGRPKMDIYTKYFDGANGVIFTDYGHTWESLKRVAHSAVRKYAVSDRLAYLVSDVIDDTVKLIMNNEGTDNPFEPNKYISITVYNILASTVFGKRFSSDDPELVMLMNVNEYFEKPINRMILLLDYLPFLRIFFGIIQKKAENLMKGVQNMMKMQYKTHLITYESGIIRDFCDALIEAKEEALKEGKESAPYLTDENLALVLSDMFGAGSDTTRQTIQWILLLMSNYPEMQNKMRNEIEEMIGDRMPLQDDKNKCHFINAFISECLRYRPVAPVAVPHKTICDVKIYGHSIPKDTGVITHLYAVLTNPNVFPDPLTFKPERFLESNGSYITSRNSGFIPFGIGRRACLGEKLASADLFLLTVRLLQATNGYEFTLPDGPHSGDLSPDPSVIIGCAPKNYKIMLRKPSHFY